MKPAISQTPILHAQGSKRLTAFAPNGSLTAPDGSPNGSDFCKSLQTRKVDGLTGKTPPGSPCSPKTSGRRRANLPSMPLLPEESQTQSNPVKPSQTKSNRPLPPRFHRTKRNWPWTFGTWSLSKAWCLVLGAFLYALTLAQADSQTLLLSGATVHTVSGETFSPGQVLIQNGKITAVGATVPSGGAQTIDLKGQHLYPGIIAMDTLLGLTEIGAVRATQDSTEVGEFTPDVESWIAVNPDSELIPVTRANGIAYFEPVPEGGVISGQSGLVATEGWTSEQRAIKKPIALHLFWPRMDLDASTRERGGRRGGGGGKGKSIEDQATERRAKMRATQDFFDEAKAYAKAKDASSKGSVSAPANIPAWEAMSPYVRGELPVMVHADETRQIKAAVEWAETNHYKMILVGGRDAWMSAELLASKKIPIIYSDTFTLPSHDTESYDVHFKAPEVLRKAGVQVVFGNGLTSMDAALTKNLPYSAAQAVAFGMPEAEALRGITLYPAQLAGVADRLGSIEPGKEATLFVADGNILDIRAQVKRMWVAGKEVSLENRHLRFYEKYKNRPRWTESRPE
jgi:imidazolonepropionase-like amidohydrolase